MTGAETHRAGRAALLAAVTALLGVLPYLGALENPFVYDDLRTVVGNPSIRGDGDLRAVLAFERFRPATNVTYALDHALWELRPFGYHLTSVVLHAVFVILFFIVARTAFSDRDREDPTWSAFAAASLFAVHPVMTEAVGYVSGRSEVLCGVFFLAAFLLLRGFLVHGGAWRLAAGFLGFAAALASREVGAMLPFVLAVYDALLLGGSGEERRRRFLRFHLPLGLVVVLAGAVRLWHFFHHESDMLPRAVWQNVMTQWEILWRYLGLLVLPVSQSVVHPTQRVATPWDPTALVAGAALVALVVLAFRLRRRLPLVGLGVAWFLLLTAPSSSLIPLNELMAEHRIYAASCGFFLAVVSLAGKLGRSRIAGAVLAAVLVALCAATVARNRVWSDPVTLWKDASEKAPLTWRAHVGLGTALRDKGDCAAAVEPFAEAIRLLPSDVGTRMDLGICLARMGRTEEARALFAEAIEIDPGFVKAYNNLGRLSVITGQARLGESYYLKALEIDPANVTARMNLALLYERQGRDPSVIRRLCREVAEIEPRAPGVAECLRKYP